MWVLGVVAGRGGGEPAHSEEREGWARRTSIGFHKLLVVAHKCTSLRWLSDMEVGVGIGARAEGHRGPLHVLGGCQAERE